MSLQNQRHMAHIRESLVRKSKEFLYARQHAYTLVFGNGEAAKKVLEDLEKFCRDKDSAFHKDPRVHALLEGRREVMLRIKDHMEFDSHTLWDKYGEGNIK